MLRKCNTQHLLPTLSPNVSCGYLLQEVGGVDEVLPVNPRARVHLQALVNVSPYPLQRLLLQTQAPTVVFPLRHNSQPVYSISTLLYFENLGLYALNFARLDQKPNETTTHSSKVEEILVQGFTSLILLRCDIGNDGGVLFESAALVILAAMGLPIWHQSNNCLINNDDPSMA
jgi:hypothetical protein